MRTSDTVEVIANDDSQGHHLEIGEQFTVVSSESDRGPEYVTLEGEIDALKNVLKVIGTEYDGEMWRVFNGKLQVLIDVEWVCVPDRRFVAVVNE